MVKSKRKPSVPRNIKFTDEQEKFVTKKAAAQGHYNFSAVIKDYVNRDMQVIGGKERG